jgi:transposase
MNQKQVNDHITSINIFNSQFLTPLQRQVLLKAMDEDLPRLSHQRIQIMLLADEGKSQKEICHALKCSPATAKHWIHISQSGMAHQWQNPIGRPKTVNEVYLKRLKELVSNNPRNYGYTFRRWTASYLNQHLTKEFGVQVSDCHIKRLLKRMGLSTKPKPNSSLMQ